MYVEKFLYTRVESAYCLGISVRAVDYRIADGSLETRRNGKKILVTRESLRRFAAGNHPQPIRICVHDRQVF